MPVLTTNASPLQGQTESSHRGLLCEESTQPCRTDLQIKLVNDNSFFLEFYFFLHQFSCHFSPVSHFSLLMQKAKVSQLSSKINDLRMTLDVEGNECLGITSPRFYNKCSSRFHKGLRTRGNCFSRTLRATVSRLRTTGHIIRENPALIIVDYSTGRHHTAVIMCQQLGPRILFLENYYKLYRNRSKITRDIRISARTLCD